MKKVLGFAFMAVFTMLFTVGLDTAEAKGKKSPESKLKGTYARTRTRTCIRTNGVFDSNRRIAPAYPGQNPYGHTRTNVISGNATFNGDGTGTLESDGLSIRNITSPSQGGTGPHFNFTGPGTCDFNYTVNSDNSFEVVISSCSSSNGSSSSGTVVQGQIGRGGQTLIISDPDSNVETITTGSGSTVRRICNRSGVAVKVKK